MCAKPFKLDLGWKAPVHPKDEDVKERIRACMAGNIIFRGLSSSEMETIVSAMQRKEFREEEVIIRQHDVGDFFYIVDSGTCDIFVENVGKVATIGAKGSFGELALMYNAPRAATVVAMGDMVTWAVDQKTFKMTLMATTMKKRSLFESFISKVPIFTGLNEYERLTVADALEQRSFSAGTDILLEGDEGNYFFIVENGSVKCTKAGVEGEVCPRLALGAYFGERALLMNDKRAATVTAVEATTCQVLDRATFIRLLGPLGDTFRSNMEVYDRYKDSIPAVTETIVESEDEDDEEEEGAGGGGAGGTA